MQKLECALILWDTEVFNNVGVKTVCSNATYVLLFPKRPLLQETTFELSTLTLNMASYPNPGVVANDTNVYNLSALHFSSKEIKPF